MSEPSAGSTVVLASTLLVCLLLVPATASADEPGDRPRLLDVPYLVQSEELCGGAAAAMVLRYWESDERTPADFAHLVDAERRGIPTGALVEELRAAGWTALPFRGDGELVRRHLERGRPVIALLEDRPGRFHYVVLVGWLGGEVVLHDPAVRPFRILAEREFRRRWAAAESWALLVLPPDPHKILSEPPFPVAGAETGDPRAAAVPSATGPTDADPSRPGSGGAPSPGPHGIACRDSFRAGVDAARSGDLGEAEEHLGAAMARCPEWSSPVRETAALRIRQDLPRDAERLAERAVRLDPDDEYAWRILAVSRHLQDDPAAALRAWNRIGEPRIGTVRMSGLDRTRHPVAMRFVELRPGELLRPGDLERTRLRLQELPFVLDATVRYSPPSDGRADVDVDLVERPLLVRNRLGLLGLGVRSLADRELEVTMSSPAGAGSVWTGSWSWADYRPRIALSASFPDPSGLGSVWRIEAHRGTRTFDFGAASAAGPGPGPGEPVVEDRRHAGLVLRGSRDLHLRWEAGLAWDRWMRHGDHLGLGGALELRDEGDALAVRLEGDVWAGLAGAGGFTRGRASMAWRSAGPDAATRWSVRATGIASSASAPLGLWSGAGHTDGPLLRAHRLHHDGTIDGAVFGRYLGQATVEYRKWLTRLGPVRVGAAGFLDLAKAWSLPGGGATPLHLDPGVGARLRLPGTGGNLRFDVARGLRDGEVAVSLAWEAAWPGWSDRR